MKENISEINLPHNLDIKIKSVYSSLKTAEKKIADYLVLHADEAKELTITEMGKKAGCSEATITRFVKKLRYDGFIKFREDLILSETRKKISIPNSFQDTKSSIELLNQTFRISIQALEDTLLSINADEFCLTVEVLQNARKIAAFGAGDAYSVALIFYNKFVRIGREAYTAQDIDEMNILCSQMDERDAIICISHSGSTRNIIHIAQQAREKGTKVIVITNYPMSKLAKLGDHVLYTAAFSTDANGEIISKRLPEMCIVDSLYLAIIMSDEKYNTALIKANNSVSYNKY